MKFQLTVSRSKRSRIRPSGYDVGFPIVVVSIKGCRSLLIILDKYKPIKYRVRQVKTWFKGLKKDLLHRYNMAFNKKTIYYSIESTDCDLCTSTNFSYKESYKEYHNWLDDPDEWDWVEGRISINIIDKDEYEYYKDKPVRNVDHIMNAFENGNRFGVVV